MASHRPSLPVGSGAAAGQFGPSHPALAVRSVEIGGPFIIKVFVLVLLWAASAGLCAAEADRAGAEAELQSILGELNDLDSWLSDAERRRLRWLKEMRDKDRAVAQTNAAAKASERVLAESRATLQDLRRRQAQLEVRRAAQVRGIARHLAIAQRFTGQEFVKLLAGQESADAVERMTIYHRFVTEARFEALEDYQGLSADMERSAEELVRRQEAERTELEVLDEQRTQLESQRVERRVLIANLEEEFEDRENRRHRLLNDRQRLQKLLAQIQRRATSGGEDFVARKGRLPWPLQGQLTGRFGQTRADSGTRWEGVLLRAALGSPVIAVHGGRVVFADWLRGFGLLLILEHGGGYMTLYGHADQLTKKVDDAVEAGEVVAHAGQSGGLGASGIYFELRTKGQPQDPLPWLGRR